MVEPLEHAVIDQVVSMTVRGFHFIPNFLVMGFNSGTVLFYQIFQRYQDSRVDPPGFPYFKDIGKLAAGDHGTCPLGYIANQDVPGESYIQFILQVLVNRVIGTRLWMVTCLMKN